LSANSVMRGRLDARRTLKSLVADLRVIGERVSLMPNQWRLCIHVPGHSAGSIYRIKYLRRLPL
ncbi:hypothetical protein PN602_20260, partial [Parabacteroides distasonis]|nr:hypothetical protein [Parabacteroides distasonis]